MTSIHSNPENRKEWIYVMILCGSGLEWTTANHPIGILQGDIGNMFLNRILWAKGWQFITS